MTAVKWFAGEIKGGKLITNQKFKELLEQAKEMEKQQIIDAYHINPLESEWKNIGIDYYNETFKPE